jgi:phage terminase large subunit
MTIDWSKNADKLFTNVFWRVRKAKKSYVVVYGGASSSKSYSVHQSELINIMTPGKGNTLVLRKQGSDLRESCYALFQNLISEYGLSSLFTSVFSNDQRKITYKPTGRALIFKGVDDPEMLKSIVGIRRVLMEEANQFSYDDFLEINRRARGFEDIQILLILNPVSENHWIKTNMCDVGSPFYEETDILRFTYQDNVNRLGKSFVTEKDKQKLEMYKNIDENHYRIYVLAEWGVDNKEGKFVWAFNREQIVKTEHDAERITWATFDFNVNPLTCTIVQVLPEITTIRAIECFRLENSDIHTMCDRIVAAYPDVIWSVTGDASGQSRSAMVKDNVTYYQIIQQKLRLSSQQIKVPTVNPSIADNQVLVNAVHKNWTVEIDPDRCAPLIYDLTYVEVNGKGEIIKDRSSSKKFADFLDNWRYVINIAVKPYFNLR